MGVIIRLCVFGGGCERARDVVSYNNKCEPSLKKTPTGSKY